MEEQEKLTEPTENANSQATDLSTDQATKPTDEQGDQQATEQDEIIRYDSETGRRLTPDECKKLLAKEEKERLNERIRNHRQDEWELRSDIFLYNITHPLEYLKTLLIGLLIFTLIFLFIALPFILATP